MRVKSLLRKGLSFHSGLLPESLTSSDACVDSRGVTMHREPVENPYKYVTVQIV